MTNLETLRAAQNFQPEWALVLGSGLGSMVDALEIAGRRAYSELSSVPPSGVAGHAGEFVWGSLAGVRVLLACGRVHLYEGRTAAEVTAHVRLIHALGVRRLILTNAAGALCPEHSPGQWMAITDHLNLTGTSPLIGGPHFHAMDGIYTPALRQRFQAAAADIGMPWYEGVYAGLVGPQYETPAEIRMLKTLGADAVGMSTVLEAIQAHALGMEVAGFSCLTNWAAGLSTTSPNHEEVLARGRQAAATFGRLLERALQPAADGWAAP